MQRLSGSLARTTAVIVAAILATSTILFFAMPRISGGYLSRYTQSDAISTGFSESVNLGEIGRIQQSSEVVAHIHIEGDTTGDRQIRLRGAVLTLFDGRRWTNPHHDANLISQSYGRVFQLSTRATKLGREELRLARGPQLVLIRYRVLMEPLNTSVIFTIPAAQALFGAFREIGVDDDQTFHNLDHEHTMTVYEGVSDVSFAAPATLERLPDAAPDAIPDRYLQLPEHLDPRIPELARQITDSETSPYRRALAIERYLTTHYGYTLQLPSQPPADPLADFLFHRRRGHCEYFASSMAVLLRTIGIPSRIITGFRGAQFNQVNSNYIVRASDAHSWVEAYIPGAGWTTFDPTPAGDAPAASLWSRSQLYLDAAQRVLARVDRQLRCRTSAGSHPRRRAPDPSRHRRLPPMGCPASITVCCKPPDVVHQAATQDPKRLLRPATHPARLPAADRLAPCRAPSAQPLAGGLAAYFPGSAAAMLLSPHEPPPGAPRISPYPRPDSLRVRRLHRRTFAPRGRPALHRRLRTCPLRWLRCGRCRPPRSPRPSTQHPHPLLTNRYLRPA